jgi:hydroxymethylglutaryl-CoA lyase
MGRFKLIADAARKYGIPVRGYLSCVIACPYEGPIPPKEVAKVAEMLLELGCREISLGDTIGVGTPSRTIEMLDSVLDVVGNDTDKLAVHFHDT